VNRTINPTVSDALIPEEHGIKSSNRANFLKYFNRRRLSNRWKRAISYPAISILAVVKSRRRDGFQAIFSQAHAMDVFMKMLIVNEVFENELFQLLMNNLRTIPWAWKALTSTAQQIRRGAHERMSLFVEKRRCCAAERQNSEVNV
jgi:hypothetical protein